MAGELAARLYGVSKNILIAAVLLSSVFAPVFGADAAVADDAEDAYACGDARLSLDYGEHPGGERLTGACLIRQKMRSCVKLDVEFFERTWLFSVNCRGARVDIVLPLSGNYPVYKTVRLRRQGDTLRLVGIEKSEQPRDERDFSVARRLLREHKYDSGFEAWVEASEDARCMGSGCRPSEETKMLSLGHDEITALAKASFQGRDTPSAIALIEAYFAFLGKHRILAEGTPSGAASRFDDTGVAAFLVPLVNDYAFYLAERGDPARARPLLEAVVKAAADRWVAHLNLADVLWALSERDKARQHYAQYAAHVPAARWPQTLGERCGKECATR